MLAEWLFFCRHKSGIAVALDPAEVAAVRWMTAGEVPADPQVAPWTRQSVDLAGRARLARGR